MKYLKKIKINQQFLLSNDAFIRIGVLESKILRLNKLTK
jgi:hypothetical protein